MSRKLGREGERRHLPEDRSLRPVKTGVSALLTPESPPKTPGKTPASLVKLSGIHPGVWTGVQTGDSAPTGDSALKTPETPAQVAQHAWNGPPAHVSAI